MGFMAFAKFALICFDALAWPAFALGYPLCASIQAIEANSNSDTKKLVTYWVIFSLISLFEYAFMVMLQWLPFWPYMKLTIVCWLMIPHFDGAFYVYNNFVHPCLYIDVQTIINWFKKQQELFLKDNILAEADKYVKVHGPEALEKLIASESKGAEPGILQKDTKDVQVTEKRETEKREVGPENLILETAPNAAQTVNNTITLPEIKGAVGFDPPEITTDKQVQKEWTCAMCQVTTSSEKTLNSHLQGRRHRDVRAELMKAKNQPSKGKEFASVVRDKGPSSSSTQASQKTQQPSKGQVSASSIGNQLKPSEKVNGQQQGGKKLAGIKIPQFRCTICNVNCSRSEDLNCHLWGKKHLLRIQELNSLVGRGELA
ncbi:uncharacterized protein LOC111309065 [Durio zibethinus]|uniref:HVA22-like protein n=1 Tax=Durio zibethinus TaxID=66656 RepID=A0A6P6AFH6_DURZI|nr:uncharacterized protein LOC111309065 [Durio zibethinus]